MMLCIFDYFKRSARYPSSILCFLFIRLYSLIALTSSDDIDIYIVFSKIPNLDAAFVPPIFLLILRLGFYIHIVFLVYYIANLILFDYTLNL